MVFKAEPQGYSNDFIIQSIFPHPQELEPDFSETVWDTWEQGFPFLLIERQNWKVCFLRIQLKTGNSK